MKKLIFIVITFVSYFCLSICVTFKENSSNNDFNLVSDNYKQSYNNYMEAYFNRLSSNFGLNYKNSCGYVAISNLLSYYDNYISDDIIDEKYDVSATSSTYDFTSIESPGTLHEIESEINKYNNYYDYICSTKDTSFHRYLISLGIELKVNSKTKDEFGTSIDDRVKIINNYLKSRNTKFSIETEEKNIFGHNVRKFTIDNMKKGNPVLLSIHNKTDGHAVIAYEYDEVNDKLYCHSGYYGLTRRTPEELGFTKYTNAMVLKINKVHYHTNNYILNGKEYCYCYNHIKVYKDITHNYKYSKINDMNHYSKCECGHTQIDSHQFSTSFQNGKTIYKCILCNAVIDGDKPQIISL